MMFGKLHLTAFGAALALAGCATEDPGGTFPAGFNSTTGWSGEYVNGVTMVTGEVATPINPVKGPVGTCTLKTYVSRWGDAPSAHPRGVEWDQRYLGGTVVSGSLPPGLMMDQNGTITGVPLQRGNWDTTLRAGTDNCVGKPMGGESYRVIFKIGGSGVVHQ